MCACTANRFVVAKADVRFCARLLGVINMPVASYDACGYVAENIEKIRFGLRRSVRCIRKGTVVDFAILLAFSASIRITLSAITAVSSVK